MSSTIDQAREELKRINFGEPDSSVMIRILEIFFAQWDSSSAAMTAAPILQKLIAGEPLSQTISEEVLKEENED